MNALHITRHLVLKLVKVAGHVIKIELRSQIRWKRKIFILYYRMYT